MIFPVALRLNKIDGAAERYLDTGDDPMAR